MARLDQVRNARSRALSYPNAITDLTESARRVRRDATENLGVVGEERPPGHAFQYAARGGDIHESGHTLPNVRNSKHVS